MLIPVFSFRTRLLEFLRCHAEALEFFGGAPHAIVHDNFKSVVMHRWRTRVIFNLQFLRFADRSRLRPLPTWPGEPYEKGLVE
jgi:transposase